MVLMVICISIVLINISFSTGIVLMILETELSAANVINREHWISLMLKMLVTASTVALLIFIFMYHKLGIV